LAELFTFFVGRKGEERIEAFSKIALFSHKSRLRAGMFANLSPTHNVRFLARVWSDAVPHAVNNTLLSSLAHPAEDAHQMTPGLFHTEINNQEII
jgi:hypothetical protein